MHYLVKQNTQNFLVTRNKLDILFPGYKLPRRREKKDLASINLRAEKCINFQQLQERPKTRGFSIRLRHLKARRVIKLGGGG